MANEVTPFSISDNFNTEAFNKMIGQVNTGFAQSLKVLSGSYVGTGTYYKANPTTITFDEPLETVPSLLFVFSKNTETTTDKIPGLTVLNLIAGFGVCFNKPRSGYTSVTTMRSRIICEATTSSISWYVDYNIGDVPASSQANVLNETYYWIAI